MPKVLNKQENLYLTELLVSYYYLNYLWKQQSQQLTK
jgi:hypothetical protein